MKRVTKRMNLNPTNSSLSRSLATRRTSPCFELLVQGWGDFVAVMLLGIAHKSRCCSCLTYPEIWGRSSWRLNFDSGSGSGFGQYECLELGPMAQAFSSLLSFDDHTPNNVLNKAMGIFCEVHQKPSVGPFSTLHPPNRPIKPLLLEIPFTLLVNLFFHYYSSLIKLE